MGEQRHLAGKKSVKRSEIYSEIYYIFQFIRIFGIFGKLKNSRSANSIREPTAKQISNGIGFG